MHQIYNATIVSMQTVIQLISQFVPENYKLSLKLNRIGRTFDGTVVIKGNSVTDAGTITLHSKGLNIESVTVDDKNAEFSFADNDALIITQSDINTGEHTISIKFNGKITDAMHGLYPCYFEHAGVKKELLATQFESHHAREVFPCVDEPAAKATFDVTLTTESDIIVLGNMPVKSQTNEGSQLITTFETTPIMSSYLLAWVVGELHKKTAKTKNGIEVNVWATPAQSSDSLDFALDIATRSIDFYEEYFDTPYPLPKSDQVALPDFESGAMENWGLVTYREAALLADPKTISISSKHYIATVIAHELSHQWFGNLVTMKWWNDLWLNESFASLVEYIAVDALEPSWNAWEDFASFESMAALRRDSVAGVQSVQTDVNHPDEIGTLFDGAIVYAKGARLLQMLQHYIGEDAFRSGLTEYFKTYAYKNTEANDLWNSLSNASGKDIASFMNRWISQPGYPVLHVSRQNNQILLSQERLTNDRSVVSDSLWPIPLYSNDSDLPDLFDTKSIQIDSLNSDILRFNVNNYAHFITHYSNELLQQIITEVAAGKISTIDRLQILNEHVLLANAGIISSAELISLIAAYKDETTEAVWNIISMAIGEIKKFVETDKAAEEKLHQLAGSLSLAQYERLGWTMKPGESESDSKLRSTIIGLALYSENNDAINQAIEIYNSTDLNNLDPELRGQIIAVAVRQIKDRDIVSPLIETLKTTDSPEIEHDICAGVTATKDENIVTRLLNNLKDSSIIRHQDTFRWMIYLVRNKYGRTLTWQWIRDNWDWIKSTFGGDKSYSDYPRYTATALSTNAQLDEYREFFMPLHGDPSLTRTIDMGINEITNRVNIIERDGEAVRAALLNL